MFSLDSHDRGVGPSDICNRYKGQTAWAIALNVSNPETRPVCRDKGFVHYSALLDIDTSLHDND